MYDKILFFMAKRMVGVMERINIAICDDNNEFANLIKKEICSYMDGKRNFEIIIFNNGIDLLKQFDKEFVEVVFLDIDMPKISGFETALQLQKRKNDILIIFITNHEDKVFQSYEYHPFWFIRKSHIHDLKVVMPKLLRKIDAERENKRLTFNLITERCTVELDINRLTHIESCKNDIIIFDKVKGKFKLRCKIASVEKQLYPLGIIRIQNGILVNCRFIAKITSREVILTDGTQLGLSRSKIGFAKEEYQNFIRRML